MRHMTQFRRTCQLSFIRFPYDRLVSVVGGGLGALCTPSSSAREASAFIPAAIDFKYLLI